MNALLLRMIIAAFLATLSTAAFAQQRPLILATFDYPPYVTAQGDDAQPGGMMIEIWTEIARRTGQKVEFRVYPFKRELVLVEQGHVDGLFSIKKTPEREKRFLYPNEPLMIQDYVFFTLKNSKIEFRGNLDAFSNVPIGVNSGVSYGPIFDSAVKRGMLKNLHPAPSYDLNFKMLLNGRVNAVICSRLVGVSILEKLGMRDQVRVSSIPVETTKSYVIFSKKTARPALIPEFDKAISSMRRDGTMKSIEQKYFSAR